MPERSYSASVPPDAPSVSAAHPESASAEIAPIANSENFFEDLILFSFV
jgi:hypothetical protein